MTPETTTTTETAVETAPKTTTKASKAPKAKAPKASKAPIAISGKLAISYEADEIEVAIDLIDELTNLTRPEGREGDIEELVESIRSIGQRAPIEVQRIEGSGRFRLAAGFRRTEAMRRLGRKTIRARVLTSNDEDTRLLANVLENENARKDISPLGRVAGYEFLQSKGNSVAEIAATVGKAEDFVRDHLRISNGAPEVRAALALAEGTEGSVSWGVARLILRRPKGEQAALLKRLAGLSVLRAVETLKADKAAKSAKASHDSADEGSDEGGEGDEGGESAPGTSLDAERVATKLVGFIALQGDVVIALRQAVEQGDLEAVAKVANAVAKGATRYESTLRALCGDAAFEAAVKGNDAKVAKARAA